LETKIYRAIRPTWRGKPADATRLIWRRKYAELSDLLGEENLHIFSSPNKTGSYAGFPLQIGLIALQVFLSK
jgi:predicted transcriptional regulator